MTISPLGAYFIGLASGMVVFFIALMFVLWLASRANKG